MKALSILNENYGNIYVRFGESFSVKDYFGREIDRSLHSFGPVQLQDLTLSETKQIIRLAHAIVDKQRELTVITCFNLVAAVLNNNIVNGKEPFTLENLVGEVSWLSSVLKKIGVVVAVNGSFFKIVIISRASGLIFIGRYFRRMRDARRRASQKSSRSIFLQTH